MRCAATAAAASAETGPVTERCTRNAGVPSMAASVSYCARLISARSRVATGGSVTSNCTAFSAMLFQVSTASVPNVPARVIVTVAWRVLPAMSVAVSVSRFAPSAKATSVNWNSPPAPANAEAAPSATCEPVSVVPDSTTRCALVMPSPGVPVSDVADKPNTSGLTLVSSVKVRSCVPVLPKLSVALRCRVCVPSANVPPASWFTSAALSAYCPLTNLPRMLV